MKVYAITSYHNNINFQAKKNQKPAETDPCYYIPPKKTYTNEKLDECLKNIEQYKKIYIDSEEQKTKAGETRDTKLKEVNDDIETRLNTIIKKELEDPKKKIMNDYFLGFILSKDDQRRYARNWAEFQWMCGDDKTTAWKNVFNSIKNRLKTTKPEDLSEISKDLKNAETKGVKPEHKSDFDLLKSQINQKINIIKEYESEVKFIEQERNKKLKVLNPKIKLDFNYDYNDNNKQLANRAMDKNPELRDIWQNEYDKMIKTCRYCYLPEEEASHYANVSIINYLKFGTTRSPYKIPF